MQLTVFLTMAPAAVFFRWAVAVGAAVIAAIGVVLLFLLAQATNNRELYERNYERLFILNMVVAGLLLAVIGWMGLRLLSRLRQGKFGSRLLIRLAMIFALVNVVAVLQTWGISMALYYLLPLFGVASHVPEIAHAVGVMVPVFTSYIGHKKYSFK